MYLHILLQTICLILGIPLLRRLAAKKNKKTKISKSIHSVFLFLEDRLAKSSHVLDIEMSQNLHMETMIRLFRRRIRDVPFLHLLRIVFHAYETSYGKFIQFWFWKQKEQRSIDVLFQNFYTYEIDSILLLLWTQLCKSESNNFAYPDKLNIILKKKCISKFNIILHGIDVNKYLFRELCIHFVRYKNRSLIIFQGAYYFVKKWIHYLLIFLRSHFHYPTEFIQIRMNLLSASCVFFLGYISTIRSVSKDVQIETIVGSYNSLSGGRVVYPRIPISLLVKLLEKEKFCDNTGHPIGKLSWCVLTDDDILKRFVKIWNTFSSYYSAAINRDGLRRLRYIPRLSCDSTLASKHRSTIRFLRRRFDLELPKVVPTYSNNSSKIDQRVWHLSINESVLLTIIPLEL